MSLTGSRTLIRRSAEQWREIQQRFEHSGQTQVAFCAAEGLALCTFTLAAQAWQFPGNDN